MSDNTELAKVEDGRNGSESLMNQDDESKKEMSGKYNTTTTGSSWNALKKQLEIEWGILKSDYTWAWILAGAINQYLHSVWTNLVYYFYEVRPALRDIGFEMTPKIGEDYFWVSEAVFYPLFIVGLVSAFWPLALCFGIKMPSHIKPHNLVVLWKRFFIHVTICQTLRALSFMFTILPGPAEHCQDSENENFNQPKTAVDVLFRMDASYGCGDLIFSSHTIFTLTVCLMITYYLPIKPIVWSAWIVQAVLIFLILCSRKHYTVDIVVALYTVPMVWWLLQYRWSDPPAIMFYDKRRSGVHVEMHGDRSTERQSFVHELDSSV